MLKYVNEFLKVRAYVESAARKSDLERTDLQKEKRGVFTGMYALNPATNESIPIWVADYVLGRYLIKKLIIRVLHKILKIASSFFISMFINLDLLVFLCS